MGYQNKMSAMKVTTKIGDVFSVRINDETIKYFQLIATDLTQLNSDVIRTFNKIYPLNSSLDLLDIVTQEVDFYAHCVTKWGLKMGYWNKVGNISDIGKTDHILFRDSSDFGNPEVKISQNWWIWKINEEQIKVGKLTGANEKAEIGIIMDPESIVHRIRTGCYDGVYPDYK